MKIAMQKTDAGWEAVLSSDDGTRKFTSSAWSTPQQALDAALTDLAEDVLAFGGEDAPPEEEEEEEEPAPPPVEAFPGRSKWFGTNLFTLDDSAPYQLFHNVLHQARPWISCSWSRWNDGRPLALNAAGEVTSLLPDQIARTVIFSGARPAEDFTFAFDGVGTFTIDNAALRSLAPGRFTVRPAATGNVILNITSVSASDPMRNLKLARADENVAHGLFSAPTVFELAKYKCLRVMDLQRTNFVLPLADRKRNDLRAGDLRIASSDARRVDVLCALASAARTDLWLCVTPDADAEYIETLLRTVRTFLDADLKCYVEYGNENWNSAFPRYNLLPGANHDTKMQGVALKAFDLADSSGVALPLIAASW